MQRPIAAAPLGARVGSAQARASNYPRTLLQKAPGVQIGFAGKGLRGSSWRLAARLAAQFDHTTLAGCGRHHRRRILSPPQKPPAAGRMIFSVGTGGDLAVSALVAVGRLLAAAAAALAFWVLPASEASISVLWRFWCWRSGLSESWHKRRSRRTEWSNRHPQVTISHSPVICLATRFLSGYTRPKTNQGDPAGEARR